MTPEDTVDTPEKVILAINEGWPKSVYATATIWRVQYLKQLDVFRGPDLAAGFQRVLENLQKLTKGTPPKPDVIADMCRQLKQQRLRIDSPRPVREADDLPPSKILSPQMLAFNKRQIAELNQAIENDTAEPMTADLLRWYQSAIDVHQKALEQR